MQDFSRKHKGMDIRKNQRALRRLLTACDNAKLVLSSSAQAVIEVDSLLDGVDYTCTISRAKFEELNQDLFKKTMQSVEKVLKDASVTKKEVNEVVLIGGSTRIPQVQGIIEGYFGKEACRSINAGGRRLRGSGASGSALG